MQVGVQSSSEFYHQDFHTVSPMLQVVRKLKENISLVRHADKNIQRQR